MASGVILVGAPAARFDAGGGPVLMLMNWNDLLSDHRAPLGDQEAEPSRVEEHRTAFEADYDRVVYSAPFRRLARKTQVHPLAAHDHVHNRLTHSLEVASVGRSFARRLGDMLHQRGEIERERIGDLCQIVQAACLVHDIGNPPFGHAGEFAIREWIRAQEAWVFERDSHAMDAGLRADWACFEGNAQGFRLAARPDNPQTGYMRLTDATLGAMIKYPWDSLDDRVQRQAKFNVFSTEKRLFESMAQRMGLKRPDGSVARHPLSFLTEAADDICYRILDLEDAVDMGILGERVVRDVLSDFLGEPAASDRPLAMLRGQVIRELVDACWAVFEGDVDRITRGGRSDDLKSDLAEPMKRGLAEISRLYGAIFADRAKVAIELGAYETLGRILTMLIQAVRALTEAGDFDATDFLTRRRLELAWGERYARANTQQPYAWWLHQVLDHVAGLTDNYARQLAREIAGV